MASASSKMLTRVFHPSWHLWLETVSQTPSHRWLKLGLTERGMQDIGDVTFVQRPTTLQGSVERGQELLQIHFEGHSITAADELYHTMWETFSDQIHIASPITGTMSDNESIDEEEEIYIDEDTVLASLKVEEQEFQRQCKDNNLVHEPQYLKFVQKLGPGKFSD